MTSAHFQEITAADIRTVKRLTAQLAELPDLATLGRELIRGAGKFLPADFMVWNLWTPAMDALLGFEASDEQFIHEVDRRSEALVATIHEHPIMAGGLELTKARPQRISDYQSDATFRSTALFQEVYRHLESHHQMAFSIASLADGQIILSWNLRHRDFSDREVQLLHLLGQQVGVLSRRIEEYRHLQTAWTALAGVLASVSDLNPPDGFSVPMLGIKDGRILSGLIRGESRADIAAALNWRRDTLDRHLGALRERLGFENTSQLMQALAALRAA
jgi:GAF domain-containing protein